MAAYLWIMLVLTVVSVLVGAGRALNGETSTTSPNEAAVIAAINCGFLVWIAFLLAGA